MNMVTTSIKIEKSIKDAAKNRAAELNMTFAAYYEDLILRDLKNNRPELFKDIIKEKDSGIKPKLHRSALIRES